jgi:hypothetical protein
MEDIMAEDRLSVEAMGYVPVMPQEPYEVAYFAARHGILLDQARRIIKRYGNNRDKCDAAAQLMR